jgi:hypothetical protein
MPRRVVFACVACLVALLLTTAWSRAVHAAAPFCDVRAVSNSAPPPVLPVADVRLEEAATFLWLACGQLRAQTLVQGGIQTPGEPLPPPAPSADGELGLVQSGALPGRCPIARVPVEVARSKGPSGFRTQVFRPPR